MCTSEKCAKCDGSPLRTGECDPRACTVVFPSSFTRISTADFNCLNCGFGCYIPWSYCPKCGKKLGEKQK